MDNKRIITHLVLARRKVMFLLIPIVIICSLIGYRIYKYYNYTGELVGIRGTGVYHRDDCQFIKKANTNTIVLFQDRMQAAEAGYRACKTCNPPDNIKELEVVAKKQNEESSSITKNSYKKFDINKCKVLGSSADKSSYVWTITGTVKNNNDVDVSLGIFYVQAIFYDKDKKPIATQKSRCVISSGEIGGFTITQYENINNINSYKLTLIQ